MPYRPSYGVAPYSRKRKRYVKPRVVSRWGTYAAAGHQVLKDVMYLKTLINSEPHNHFVQSANNFNWNGFVVSLCNVPQDDTNGGRTGNRILPRFLNLNVHIENGSNNNVIRVIVFRYWGEASGAFPLVTPAEVLRTIGTSYCPLSHLNEDNVGPRGDRTRRIEVLRNEFVSLDNIERRCLALKFDIEMNGVAVSRKEHIEFRSSATEDPISGGVYILFAGKYAVNDGFILESKMTFYDN